MQAQGAFPGEIGKTGVRKQKNGALMRTSEPGI
jgi:hypothetical protein